MMYLVDFARGVCPDLIFLLNAIFEHQEELGENTFVCFIDVKKAHDSV